jgi:hypothetical protein
MPSLITHYLFADDFLSRHQGTDSFVSLYPDAFRLASQGPDPFFFVGLLPQRKLHLDLAKMRPGSVIHHSDCRQMISLMLEETDKGMLLEGDRQLFKAFILGQIAHYVLDSTCHPYVYYWTGFDATGHLSGKFNYEHAHFEARLDASQAAKRSLGNLLSAPWDVLNIKEEDLKTISEHFTAVLETFFNRQLPSGFYCDAVFNMKDIYRYVNTGSCFRRALIYPTHLRQLRLPKTTDPICLNDEHLPWKEPKDGHERRESFSELYQKASRKLDEAYAIISRDGFSVDNLTPLIFSGLNYNGLKKDEKNIYFDKERKLLEK